MSLEKIDNVLDTHVKFLKEQYALGNFIVSGRKVPRTGGIILSPMKDKIELESIIQNDPFYKKDMANYDLIEFVPTMSSDELISI